MKPAPQRLKGIGFTGAKGGQVLPQVGKARGRVGEVLPLQDNERLVDRRVFGLAHRPSRRAVKARCTEATNAGALPQ